MKRSHWIFVPAAIVSALPVGFAAQYLSVEQAQKELFPDTDRFEALDIELSKEQMKDIQSLSKITVRNKKLNVWRAVQGQQDIGTFWVDQVIGKHEFITYAVGINPDGRVKQVEIMDYRETYGYQVREADWRKQFVGRRSSDQLKLGQDIQNISGATLSCRNVTDGVKRILSTFEIAVKK